MKITIIGTGYVGLVTGTCFADVGNDVLCLDVDEAKIAMLERGEVPIYEPGLDELIRRNRAAGRLQFTCDAQRAVAFGEIQCIAVGTPPDEDGSADLKHVLAAARGIGRHMTAYRVIADKSTVPVGTADLVRQTIAQELKARGLEEVPFSVVSNPEFLKEGAAIEDFMRPDRIIIGSDDERATQLLRTLYAPFQRSHERLLVMDVRSAELTKYAANSMLATRISFMNELANIAERLGADIEQVRLGMGSDPRIGYSFLYAGAGYGGSCFPKDVQALMRTARGAGAECRILAAVEEVNAHQKGVLARKIAARFDALKGRRIALWGLAFKPNTDDMREAPSLAVIEDLLARGAAICAYDPVALAEARRIYRGEPRVQFAASPYEALQDADALAIVTEWKEFRSPDFDAIRARLKTPAVFDGRNLYEPAEVRRHGLEYHAVGRP